MNYRLVVTSAKTSLVILRAINSIIIRKQAPETRVYWFS